MPRIKRWFPVNHDINHSPTIRMLVHEYGAPGLRIWLEILSIADRAGPFIDCTSEGAIRRLSSAAETRFKVVSSVIDTLLNVDSIRLHDRINHVTEVVNYSEYHRTEERKRFPPDQTRPNRPHRPPPISPKGGLVGDLAFQRFWDLYPKKVNKPAAIRAWKKEAALHPDIQEKIIAAVELHKRQPSWLKDNGQFVPYPSSWLNGKRWNDPVEQLEEPEETREEALARMNRIRARAGMKPYDPNR